MLKDGTALSEYKVEDGHTIHLVKGKSASAGGTAATSSARSTAAPTPTSPPQAASATSPSAAGAGTGALPSLPNSAGQVNPLGQMMESMLGNPAMLQAMIQSNPMLQQMGMNPEQIAQMLNDPMFRQMLSNPLMMQMAMQQMQGGGMMGGTGTATNPFAAAGMMGQMGGAAGNSMDPFATLFGGMVQQPIAGAASANTPGQAPEVRFQNQLQQLQDMGFYDASLNLRALQATRGNVNAAVEFLLRSLQ